MRQSSRLGVLPSLKWGVGAMRWASINSATPKKLTKKEALIEANMNRVYIMDGTAMLYKAYHAGLAHSRITATPEVEVQSTLRQHCEKFLNQIKPHYLAVVLDHGKKNFRHDLMPEYKETRGETPEAIRDTFSAVSPLIASMGIRCFSVEGYEADDVMASVGHWVRASHPDMEVIYVSDDKDMLQLVDDKSFVMRSAKRTLWKEADVLNKFGVPAQGLCDYQALVGDKVDNIAGVPGIGAKYATFLVNQFGSLENMYRCCAQKERGEGLNGLVRRILRHAPGQSSAATTDRQVASATKKATKILDLLKNDGEKNALKYKELVRLRPDVGLPEITGLQYLRVLQK